MFQNPSKLRSRLIAAALLAVAAAAAASVIPATAQAPQFVLVPVPGTTNQAYIGNNGTGGVTIPAILSPNGLATNPRYLVLTDAKSDLGVPMTAAAGTPTGTVGVSRTAGTSLALVGEATSSSAKTDKALFEFVLPYSYVPGANIAVTVNASVSGSGTLTAASTTMTVAAYSETTAGVETALTVSAAQQMVAAGSNLVFTITGTGLVPGERVAVELVMLVTSSSGANTGTVNSVAIGS